MRQVEVGELGQLLQQTAVDAGQVVVGEVEALEGGQVGEHVLLDPVLLELISAQV